MKKYKVQFTLSERALHQLLWMKVEIDVINLAETIRQCIAFYRYLIKEKNNGWKIILKKGKREKEIILFR